MNELLTTREASKYLRIYPGTLLAMVAAGRIEHVRLGRNTIRFTRAQLQRFVDEHTVGA